MGDKMTNFRAQDMLGSGTVQVAFTKTSKPQGDPETEKVTINDANDVPRGTAKEVLKWAGSDHERIQRALDKENASNDPRRSLIEDLERAQRRSSGQQEQSGEQPVHVQADDQAQAEERPQQ